SLGQKRQLRLYRTTRIEEVRTDERHQSKKSVVLAAVRCARKKQQRLEPVGILQLLDKAMRESHAGMLVHIQVVRLVHDDEIPRFGLEHAVMATVAVLAQGMEGGDHKRVQLPEIDPIRIKVGIVLRHANVKHGEQPLLPLLNPRGGTKD